MTTARSALNSEPVQTRIPAGTRAAFLVVATLFFAAPSSLITFGVIPYRFRFVVLLIAAALAAASARAFRIGWEALGFRKDNARPAILWNTVFAIAVLCPLLLAQHEGWIRAARASESPWFYLFYVLVSCPAQEFLFRSALFGHLTRFGYRSAPFQVLYSGVVFAFMHLIYRDALTLIVALGMGLIWAALYRRLPNFWGVTVSHCILGVGSIMTGLI